MSKLVLATEGCCKGHPCDNCKTCQSGRCCRKDNPDYKLPGLGEWDGPIYGELGVLNDDGEKVECHACGKWFVGLGTHIWKVHDITEEEYKATFGLALSRGLLSPAAHERRRLATQGNLPPLADRISPLLSVTPEQRSAWARRGLNMNPHLLASRGTSTRFQQGHQNLFMGGYGSSSYVGVRWRAQRRGWMAEIESQGKRYYLGLHKTEEAAARAYDAKARELYGDKARLNFPDEVPA